MFLLIIVSFVACNGQYPDWEKNTVKNGIEFKKLRYSITNNDTTIIGILKENTEIKQMPCKNTWVYFTSKWELTMFCLSEKKSIAGKNFEKDTWILMHPGNNYFSVVFNENKTIDGFLCLGGGGPKGIRTSFYNTGELLSFFTKNDIEISDIKCAGGVLNPITLYKNGALKSCKAAENFTIAGKHVKKGEKVSLSEKGELTEQPIL